MKLIVGLGNPGRRYENTRHNIGFMVIDEFAKKEKVKLNLKTKFKGEVAQTTIHNESVILLKPNTFMNDSGKSVLALKQFYQINDEDILVIHDDLDLLCGKVRIRRKGSSGGQKGLKSIISCLNSENFNRLKIGINRDEFIPVVDYVLGKFTSEQKKEIDISIVTSVEAIYDWLTHDVVYVMNKYN
ncbi:aminoacyl-tRNA hydrolase [Mycoplasmatota bacterium]|nr:aminoacyl-tRNA hydrolase [Mycoplasmatota bacterium]